MSNYFVIGTYTNISLLLLLDEKNIDDFAYLCLLRDIEIVLNQLFFVLLNLFSRKLVNYK